MFKVLVVEDDRDLRQLFARVLQRSGYETLEAGDGQQALEVLEPRYSDNFVLKLLYEILNKQTGQRVRLPDGVFDMTTAVHGIYEDE